jgi:hypothetical protein
MKNKLKGTVDDHVIQVFREGVKILSERFHKALEKLVQIEESDYEKILESERVRKEEKDIDETLDFSPGEINYFFSFKNPLVKTRGQ